MDIITFTYQVICECKGDVPALHPGSSERACEGEAQEKAKKLGVRCTNQAMYDGKRA
jgi:hypothetical protein